MYEKRHLKIDDDEEEEVAARRRTRYLSGPSSTETKHQEVKLSQKLSRKLVQSHTEG